MRFDEFTTEGIDPSDKAAIKGMRELSGDQYYGLYQKMKDVAGHDGEKQTAPNGYSDGEVSDKPFAYAYTDEEAAMIKGVDPKAKQITSDKSEELDESQLDEFQLNPTGLLASVIRWGAENPAILAALGVAAGGGALALTGGTAVLGPLMTTLTSINAGQGALGLYSLDKLKALIQTNPSQAEGYIKKLIYQYVGDASDVQEFEKLHAQTAYKGETEFRWRAEEWPVTIDKNAAERWLEKNDRYWLDAYNKEQADKEQATAQQPTTPKPPSQQELASTVPPARPTESVGEARATGRASWDSNMSGYQGDYGGEANWGRREREDDEHHEIDRRMEQEREYRNTHGTWYVRIDGIVEPTPYTGKAAANAAALELKKQPGNENKVFMLTTKA